MSDYNGWSNYETWNVKLWIDNDQWSYDYWRDAARHSRGVNALADQLKDEINEGAPDLGPSTYADLLGAALSEVNWYELAESLREDAGEGDEEVAL